MNTYAFEFTIGIAVICFCIFDIVSRIILLKKIQREKREFEEMREVAEQMDMHMAALLMFHDYKPEEIVDMLLEGVRRYKFDEKMAATTFSLYNSVTALADSARENGIIK